jgi:hypothetical protein
MRTFAGVALIVCAWLLTLRGPGVLSLTPVARAQPAGEVGEAGLAARAEIDLRVLQFGTGDRAKPGAWTGVQVQLTDLGAKAREVVVQLALPDEDGDTALYQALVPTTPGEKTTLWLYGRLPFRLSSQSSVIVSAHEPRDPTPDERDAGIVRAGVQLARLDYRPAREVVDAQLGLIGVLGRSSAGLDLYTLPYGTGYSFPAMTHERVVLAQIADTKRLPDRWLGLAHLQTLVWTAAGTGADPTELAEPVAGALREWVQRGGHLVIVLPPVGQTWTNPGHPLADIMPQVRVVRNDQANLNDYRPLLTHRDASLPSSALVQSIVPLGAGSPSDALPILSGPAGDPVVVRRTVGLGAVTFIGLPITDRALLSLGGVTADALWNRVLGRRGRTPTPEEVTTLEKPTDTTTPRRFSPRESVPIDDEIAAQINRTGKAALGVLLAFCIFAVYWLMAGPVGFWLLKRRALSHWAWTGFVGVGAVFTLVAWTGANWLRPTRTSVQHFTVLDAVAGQGVQRARIFAAFALPRYGEMTLGIAGAQDAGGSAGARTGNTLFNAVAPWEPPPTSGGPSVFPDARGYPVAARDPDQLRVPTRSTVKSVCIDWLGGAVLKMPLTVTSESGAGNITRAEARLEDLPAADPVLLRDWRLSGALLHELPATLENVTMLLVRRQTTLPGARAVYDGQAQAIVSVRELPNWAPGEVLALDGKDTGWRAANLWLDSLTPKGRLDDWRGGGGAPRVSSGYAQQLMRLSMFGYLEPPETTGAEALVQVVRSEGHDLNLTRWATQPCIIVMGYLSASACPVPLTVEGEPVDSTGRVLVRWVLPLAPRPPAFSSPAP